MKDTKNELPRGFKVIDKTAVRGKLDNGSPVAKELQSLMVRDKRHRSERAIDTDTKPVYRKIKKLSHIISSNIQAANDLRSVTHYIKRAEQIWTTLLLKPNGDQTRLLEFDTVPSDIKNGKLHTELLQVVENYFTTKYPFEDFAPQIIRDVLFRTGSYVLMNLSHSALDHLINGMEVSVTGTESFLSNNKGTLETFFKENFEADGKVAKNIGYIRKNKVAVSHGLESIYGTPVDRDNEYNLVDPEFNWTFTDNSAVLKIGELKQKLRSERLLRRAGTETLQTVFTNVFEKKKKAKHKPNENNVGIIDKRTFEEEMSILYKDRGYRQTESLSVKRSRFYTGTGKGIGITYHVPSEAIIPVHVNGEIGSPFAFIVLTDPDTGEFLKSSGDPSFYQSNSQQGSKRDTQPVSGSINEMARHIKTVAMGGDCEYDMEWMCELASAALEKEFIEGIMNGDLNKSVTVSLSEHNKKLFLARSLQQQGVRCVYVPSEYVTYIATDYSHLGIGRSLVEEAKLQITRLAILDTANILAQIENSISKTELVIGLEKENFDPRQLMAQARDAYFMGNPTMHDMVGYNSISLDSISDRLREQSLIVKVDVGDNKHIIAPSLDAQLAQHEPLKTIDESTRDSLLDGIAGHFCLKRSWLDDVGEGNDFAIEALADQELLRNQTSSYSIIFSRFFSDFMRKHIKCNEPLLHDLIDVIQENITLARKPDQGGSLKEITKVGGKDDNDTEDLEEQSEVEMVLIDFLNNFCVELPKPAITDSLDKVTEKIEAIVKLVDKWMEMSGGTIIEKRIEQTGLDKDIVVQQIKGAFLYEAFSRFDIAMPFDTILADGTGGGMLSVVNSIASLEQNSIKFFELFLKENMKANKGWQKLYDKYGEEEQEGQEEIPGATDDSFVDDGMFSEEELPPADEPLTVPLDEETPTTDKPVEEEKETKIDEIEEFSNPDLLPPAS